MRLVVVGDTLLDRDVEGDALRLTPDSPAPVLEERQVRSRPGGAGLAAVLAARDGAEVTLITALSDDVAGRELATMLRTVGIDVVDLGSATATPEKIRLRAGGVSLARWDRGGAPGPVPAAAWTPAAADALQQADAVLVSCYGRGLTATRRVRAALGRLTGDKPLVWDPHPRGVTPVPGCALVTPNDAEAALFAPGVDGDDLGALTARAGSLVRRWEAAAVAVTRGPAGALLTTGSGLPLAVPAPPVSTIDACGAGDRFATSTAAALASGEVMSAAVTIAVRQAARFVAAGGAAGVELDAPPPRDAQASTQAPTASEVARSVRARGGTVVATGGCFDLVHAGHLHLLQAARALGDCLVVCLNSDDSVRHLKGAGRPIVHAAERRQLLEALACVDAVAVFDEDTPVESLRRLRPHVFVKGGDYGSQRIPEAAALDEWHGQAVTLPYLEGRSTTRILQEVQTRAQR